MSETLTFRANNFSLKSSWKDGSRPSLGQNTVTITVSGIPDGATVNEATFSCTFGSPSTGASELKVNGNSASTSSTFTYHPSITGNGTYDFKFTFRANGSSAAGSHMGTVTVSDVSLAVEYTGDAPDEDPDIDIEDTYDYPDSHNICVYAPDDDDFTTNGLGILTPTKCTVTEEAGGEYELELELPVIDDAWKAIDVDSIIKAPVPVVIVDQFEQGEARYWKVKSNQSGVKVMSKVPTITRVASTSGYSAWSGSTRYKKGDKCVSGGKVYQFTGAGHPTIEHGVPQLIGAYTAEPPKSYWTDVTSYDTKTNSGKTLATMGRNEVFTKIETVSSNHNWIRVKTKDGVIGYVQIASGGTTYVEQYSEDPVTVSGREIRQQCFRVYSIEKDSDTMMVKVFARHLSYDAANVYLGTCEAHGISASSAVSLIQMATLQEDNRQIYTDITQGTCDLDCSWDNVVSAMLNPDTGIVAQLQAKLIRDNEDFLILKDEHTDRGFRIDFGNNLRAVNWTIDISNVVTRVIPHCKNSDDSDLMLLEQWVDADNVDDYPRPYTEPLNVNCKVGQKGTPPGATEEVAHLSVDQCYAIMEAEAQKRFDVDHANEPEVTVDVDLVMLGSTVEYQHLAQLEVLFMYDTVHIRHPLLNIDIDAYMTGYEYDALLRRYNKITLTNARRRKATSVAGYELRNNSIRFEKLSSTAVDRLKS